jgi:hypothetical protein
LHNHGAARLRKQRRQGLCYRICEAIYESLVSWETAEEPERDAIQKEINTTRKHDSMYLVPCGKEVRNRNLFRTQEGYMGLGPATAREEDQIIFLASATVSFVMRPASS